MEPGTTDRLRHDIDRGRTGDKIPVIDPAAAPLGTDDEAAGTPPSRESVRLAEAQETSGASSSAKDIHVPATHWFQSVAVGTVAAAVLFLLIYLVWLAIA